MNLAEVYYLVTDENMTKDIGRQIKLNSTEEFFLVTDGIIEMNCVADTYHDAANLFLEYLKNQNDDCIYEFHKSGEIYEYKGTNLKTVHFIFNKHYIDVLRSRQ